MFRDKSNNIRYNKYFYELREYKNYIFIYCINARESNMLYLTYLTYF